MSRYHLEINCIPEYYPGKADTLTNIVDYIAKKYPQTLYAEFPVSTTSFDDGFRKVNYGDLANAINGVAWWLHEALGPGGAGKKFPTLAYIGPNDLRYNALILGAVKAGYKMLLASPRNSIAAQLHLFKLLDCKTMVVPAPQPIMIASILDAAGSQVLKAPTLGELLDKQHAPYL